MKEVKSEENDITGFQTKRPKTGKKPKPIEEMQKFISKKIMNF